MSNTNNRTIEKLESELVEQGLISDRSQPRPLYHPWPSPEVDIRALVERVRELEDVVRNFLPNVKFTGARKDTN